MSGARDVGPAGARVDVGRVTATEVWLAGGAGEVVETSEVLDAELAVESRAVRVGSDWRGAGGRVTAEVEGKEGRERGVALFSISRFGGDRRF